MSASLADAAAREAAWRRFDVDLDVAAGAGTGKTRVLVDRYLAWVLGEAPRRWPDAGPSRWIESVLAITFTEKAAGEMEERILRSLRHLAGQATALPERELRHVTEVGLGIARSAGLASLAERARGVLAEAHRLEVSTIHAFASTVLRRYALRLGLDPGFEIDSDGEQRERRLRCAVTERVRAVLDAEVAADVPGPAARVLGRLGADRAEALLAAWLDDGLSGPPWPSQTEPPDLAALVADLAALASALSADCSRVPTRSQGKVTRVIEHARLLGTRLGADLAATIADPWTVLGAAGRAAVTQLLEDLEGFPATTVAAKLTDAPAVAVWVAAVIPRLGALRGADPATLRAAFELLGPLAAELAQDLRRAGVLSFDDLLRYAADLLESLPDVAADLAERTGQLLVDEFQDTSPVQCRMLSAIRAAADGPRLFVVGDPKQSIYSFRRADLAAYDGFVSDLDARLVLSSSFRTQEALVTELDAAFGRLFAPIPSVQPAYESLVAVQPPLPGLMPVTVLDLSDPDGLRRADDTRELEALALVQRICALDAADPTTDPRRRWSRFAILSRVQTAAASIVQALDAAGIPNIVSGDKEFYRRQEVLDVVNLLRVIVDTADPLAWLGVLRSPLGAVTDPTLVALVQAGFLEPERRAAALDAVAARGGLAVARELVAATETLRSLLYAGDLDAFLTQSAALIPYEALYAAAYLGERKAKNVEAVLRRFRDAVASGGSAAAFVATAEANLVDEIEGAESALADATTDAVRVMTIHAAKGLEYDHVLVPRVEWESNRPNGDVVVRRLAGGLAMRLGDVATFGISELEDHEATIQAAEAVRLLYVACTRAKRTLTLMGDLKGKRGLVGLIKQALLPSAGVAWVPFGPADLLPTTSLEPERASILPRLAELVGRVPPVDLAALAETEAQPTVTSASALMRWSHDDHEVPVARVASRDAAIALGVEVHAALERWDGAPIPLEDLTAEARAVLQRLFGSPLAVRVSQARHRLHEVPFLAGGPSPAHASAGAIDLVLIEEGGVTVVDFKTNRVASEAHARAAAVSYGAQARLYTDVVRRALGETHGPVRFELWFLAGPWVVPVP